METRSGVVEVELLTATHRIVGKLEVGVRRLSDVLNARSEVSLCLQEARISTLTDTEAPMRIDSVHVFKEGILLALPYGGERPGVDILEYRAKSRHRVQLSLPPFIVLGDLHLAPQVNLRKALAEGTPFFLPLSGAQIVYMPQPNFTWTRPVAILNRTHASFFRPVSG